MRSIASTRKSQRHGCFAINRGNCHNNVPAEWRRCGVVGQSFAGQRGYVDDTPLLNSRYIPGSGYVVVYIPLN